MLRRVQEGDDYRLSLQRWWEPKATGKAEGRAGERSEWSFGEMYFEQ